MQGRGVLKGADSDILSMGAVLTEAQIGETKTANQMLLIFFIGCGLLTLFCFLSYRGQQLSPVQKFIFKADTLLIKYIELMISSNLIVWQIDFHKKLSAFRICLQVPADKGILQWIQFNYRRVMLSGLCLHLGSRKHYRYMHTQRYSMISPRVRFAYTLLTQYL